MRNLYPSRYKNGDNQECKTRITLEYILDNKGYFILNSKSGGIIHTSSQKMTQLFNFIKVL